MASHAAERPDILDEAVLRDLLDSAGEEVFREIGETFAEQVDLLVNQARDSAGEGDVERFQRTAHELAGAAGTFGALALANQARIIMDLCRKGDRDDALAQLPGLVEIAEETQAAFGAYLDRLS